MAIRLVIERLSYRADMGVDLRVFTAPATPTDSFSFFPFNFGILMGLFIGLRVLNIFSTSLLWGEIYWHCRAPHPRKTEQKMAPPSTAASPLLISPCFLRARQKRPRRTNKTSCLFALEMLKELTRIRGIVKQRRILLKEWFTMDDPRRERVVTQVRASDPRFSYGARLRTKSSLWSNAVAVGALLGVPCGWHM